MSLILNIRGTNGSGKSTAARALIEGPGVEYIWGGVRCLTGPGVCLIGPYPPGKTGGCDRVKTFDLMRGAIREAATQYPLVVFEGVTVSTVFGSWAEFHRGGTPFWWLYLDTPLELCVARVSIRNGGKPFDTEMVADKFRAIERTREKAMAEGFPVYTLHHQTATDELRAFALLG